MDIYIQIMYVLQPSNNELIFFEVHFQVLLKATVWLRFMLNIVILE